MNRDRRVLHLDVTGDDVRQLHGQLAALGFDIATAEQQGAMFGPNTRQAVMQFQTAQGLEPTGLVDANTAAAVDRAVASTVFVVTGTVSSPDRAGVGGLSVQLVDKGVGADAPLGAPAATDGHGAYKISVTISLAQLQKRMKTQPDLQVTVSAGSTLIGSSDVIYNATTPVKLNVLLSAGLTVLPSEYETLVAALAVNYSGHLRDLQESSTRQDITYLANKAEWDARPVAMAALSDQLSAATTALAGASPAAMPDPKTSTTNPTTPAIRPEFYYALLRAGFPANPSALYRTDPQTVGAVWQKAIAQGVIPSSLSKQIPAAAQAFQSLAAAQILQAAPPLGVSSMGALLQVTLGDDTKQQQQFAALYAQYPNDPTSLWKAVQQQFGAAVTARLQLDGQLGYLTINNADVIAKLHAATASSPLTTTLDLVSRGFYQASAWTPLITAAVPPQVPGNTPAEQQANYASLLASQVRIAYPTAVVADLVQKGTAQVLGGQTVQTGVAAFLNAQQEQFNIGTEPVEAYIARTKIGGTQPDVVAQIKRIQRVYQITQTDQAMTALLDPRNNIDSAYRITRHSRASFEAAYAEAMGGQEIAAQTYTKALQVYSAVLNVASTYLLARRAPPLGLGNAPIFDTAPSNVMAAAHTVAPAQATLETLFGSLDYCRCDECRSILGPAAYLVDLLDYIDIPGTGTFLNPQDVLFARRPDIQYLPLTCENTNTVLPYIDLVNETLEYYVANSLSLANYTGHDTGVIVTSPELLASPQYVNDAAYTILKSSWFPPPLPFHRELELLRLHFLKLGVPLQDAMQALLPDGGLAAFGWRDIFIERVGFSRDEYRLLTDSTLTLQQIYGYPGLTDAAVIPALSSFQDFSRRTGVSYLDLTSILETRFINPNCVLIPKLNALNVPITAIQALGTTPTPAQIAAFQETLPAGLDLSAFGGDVIVWLTNPMNFANIMGLIVIANPGDSTDLCTASGLQFLHADGSPLTAIEFVRMLRFQRLWQKLDWTIGQTDNVLAALCPPAADLLSLDACFRVLLGRLGFLLRIMDLLGLTADDDLQSLLACWAPIGVGPSSLYESMFLTPTLLQQDPAFAPDPYGAVLQDATELLLDHEAALRAALNLTGAEFSSIVAALGFDEQTTLSLENVSAVFRQGWMARTLELSVVEFLALKQFTGIDPFDSPDPAFSVAAANGTVLAIATQPANQMAGVPLATVVVQVQDSHGNLVPSSNVPVTLVLSPAGVSMSANAAGGVATFSGGLVFNKAGSYTLTATATGAAPATSPAFAIAAAAAAQMAFALQPENGTASAALSPAVVAEVQDTFGNRVNSTATATISSTPSGASGTLTANAVAGIATFDKVVLPNAGHYRLTVSSTGLTSATSGGFPVSAATGNVLAIATQPVNQTAGVPLASVVVRVQDGGGTLVASSAVPVTLTSSPGGVSVTVNAAAGVATFTGLIFTAAGAYTLSASASGNAPAASAPFTIAPAAAAQLALDVPSQGGTAGSPLSPAVAVQVQDAFGNLVNSNVPVTISSTPAGAIGTLTANAAAGVATFSNIVLPGAGNYMLTASAAGLVSAISMVGPAPVIGFIQFVQALETASLQPVQALYLMWNQDLSGTSAPPDSAVNTLARTLRADFAAVESQFTLVDDPSGAIAQGLMALVYGTQATDFFFGLLSNTFSTVITPATVLTAPLPAQVLADSNNRLSYDPLRNRLAFTGYLDPATSATLNTDSAAIAPLQTALATLAAANQAAVNPFFGTYPELLPLYLGYVQSADAVQIKRTTLLDAFLPDLKTKRKQEQALAAITSSAGVDPSFAPALLNDATVMFAAALAIIPAIEDLTGVEAPGLSGRYLATVGGTITAGNVITTTINGTAVPYTVTTSDGSLPTLASNIASAIDAAAALNGAVTASSNAGVVILDPPAGATISIACSVSSGATETYGGPVSGAWTGYLDVPQDGFYMFSVAADASATVTLEIDGNDIPMSLLAGVWQSAGGVSLTAGELTGISLKASGMTNTPVLSWQNPAAGLGWQPVPGPYLYSSVLVEHLRTAYIRFLKATALASDLSLTADELAYLASSPDLQVDGQAWLNRLSVSGSPDAAPSAALRDVLAAVMDFSRIKAALSPKDERLLEVLQNPAGTLANGDSALLRLTGWAQDSLDALLQQFYANTSLANLSHLENLRQVYDAYAVVKRCGISAADLIEVATNDPSAATVAALQATLRALYAESDWLAVVKPINDTMRDRQRTALVAYVLQRLGDQPATSYINTSDRLFEYFLMDVEMEPCMQTSRIRNALSSVQLFIERCLRNLESQVDPSAIPSDQWEWRKRYRVWQVVRELFLWPENWLYPELRDDQSQFFKDAMSELLQSDITDDTAAVAYLNYLTKLEGVAKLEPVGLYYTPAQSDPSVNQGVHMVARTAGAHCKYYYRRLEDGSWTPWEEIKLEIEDTPVTPYVWNGRVMLFWLKLIKQMPVDPSTLQPINAAQDSDLAGGTVGSVQSTIQKNAQSSSLMTVQAMLCWSEYYNGKWQPTKTSDHNRPVTVGSYSVASDPASAGAFDRTQLRLRAGPLSGLPDDALFVGVEPSPSAIFGAEKQELIFQAWTGGSLGTGGSLPHVTRISIPVGFVLYNTHSLPLRSSDVSIPGQPARLRRIMGATYPSAAQTTFSIGYSYGDGSTDTTTNILTSPMGERAVDCQPIVDNEWDAPFFFEDSLNVFYVTTTEEMVTVSEWNGYGILQTGVTNPLAVNIPPLVQVPPAPIPPRNIPINAGISAGVSDPLPIQQFVSTDPYIQTAIGTTGTVTYGGVEIGPAGNIGDVETEG